MKSTEKDDPVLTTLRDFLKRAPLVPDSTLLVAISGGVDSTALAIAFKELSNELPYKILLAYFNHRLRSIEEESQELTFVKNLASTLEFPLTIGEAERGALLEKAKTSRRSLEDVAREERYQYFRKAAIQNKASHIVTAHTASDCMETQIIRFFQGSSPAGLRGIEEVRGSILRPFLGVKRSDIEAYLMKRGVQPIEDSSNRNVRFLRNAVRHRFLPVVQEIFPGYFTSLRRLHLKMAWIEEFLQRETSLRDPWKSMENGWYCAIDDFLSLPRVLRLYSLYRLFDKSKPIGLHRFPFGFLQPFLELSSIRMHRGIWEKGGLRIRIEANTILWETNIVQKTKKGYLYLLEGDMSFLLMDTWQVDVCSTDLSSWEGVSLFPRRGNLFLRSVRSGDTIETRRGKKNLRRLFQELRIPIPVREIIPVLQGNDGVLAVFLEIAGGNAIRAATLERESSNDFEEPSKSVGIRISKIKGEV